MQNLKQTTALMGFVLIIALCNLHLLIGTDPTALIFDKGRVADGHWWRLFTHPFVHVSWYHLLLDSAAMILLWRELRLPSKLHSATAAICCAAASLLFPLLASDQIAAHGLCGFSGTAHGIAVLLGLNWVAASRVRFCRNRLLLFALGTLLALSVTAKSLMEFVTGTVFLSQMHGGELGIPIVASHLGGVLGGIAAALILLSNNKNSFGPEVKVTDNSSKRTQLFPEPALPHRYTRKSDE